MPPGRRTELGYISPKKGCNEGCAVSKRKTTNFLVACRVLSIFCSLTTATRPTDSEFSVNTAAASKSQFASSPRTPRGGIYATVPVASPGRTVFRTRDGFTQRSRAARLSGGCIGYASQGVKVAKDLLNSNELFMNRESCGSGECPRLSDVSLAAVPQIMLPATSREALRRHSRWGSCALVGNSGSLLKRRDGQRIDTHDIVVRFNEAPTVGVEAHVGNKTTHRMLNHIWAQGYADSKSAPPGFRLRQGYHPLEPNVTLLLNACIPARFCSLPRHFVQLQATMAFRRPDVQVLYSSKLCRAVTLFGMGGAEEAEYHYYDMGHGTVIKRGFRTHNFHLERLLVRDLARRGFLRVCGTGGCGT